MQSEQLNQWITQSLEVHDNGFTELVMNALPPEPKASFSFAHKLLWLTTALVVFGIVLVGAKSFEFTSWMVGGSLVIMVISAVLVWAHVDEGVPDVRI